MIYAAEDNDIGGNLYFNVFQCNTSSLDASRNVYRKTQ